jgi:MFS family permease
MRNPLARAFRALENFNFRLWTAGGLVSNIGTWMQRVAQDWIVLTQLTHHDALSTKPTMRGRVMAIRVGVALGGTSMGAPLVGWVANHFGPRWSLGIAAISAFLAALVAALMMAKPVAAPLDT